MDYFDKRAVSNSMMSRVEFFHKQGYIHRFKDREQSTKSMDLGSLVHAMFERDTDDIFYIPYYGFLSSLPEFEKKWVVRGLTAENYVDIYNNKTTKKLKEFDPETWPVFDEYKEIQEKIIKLSEYAMLVKEADREQGDRFRVTEKQRDECVSLYNTVMGQSSYASLMHRCAFAPDVFNELEIYWVDKETGLPCKSKLDRVYVFKDKIIMIDYKTHGGDRFESNVFAHDYTRQMSFYCEALRAKFGDNMPIEVYFVAIDTKYYFCHVIEVAPSALKAVEHNYHQKPYWFDSYNLSDQIDVVCPKKFVNWCHTNGIWNRTVHDMHRYGWRDLLNLIKDENLLYKYDI